MSTIKIPYTRPPIADPRPTPQNKKFATNIGRMLEAHIRKWCSTHHTHTPGTITLHYQPKKQQPDDTLRPPSPNANYAKITQSGPPTATRRTWPPTSSPSANSAQHSTSAKTTYKPMNK